MSTETLDKIYLEYSTITDVKTAKEIELEALLTTCAADKEQQIAALEAEIAALKVEVARLQAIIDEQPEPEPEPEPDYKLIFNESLETSVPNPPFDPQLGGPKDSITSGHTVDGRKCSRFRVTKVIGQERRARAQARILTSIADVLDGREYVIRWAMYIDPRWQPANNGQQFVTMQIHGHGSGPQGYSPPFTMREENGIFEAIYRYGDVSGQNAKVKSGTLYKGKLPRGRWLEYELSGRWVQATETGYLHLVENGKLIGSTIGINNCYHRGGIPSGATRNPNDAMQIQPANYAPKLNLANFPSNIDIIDIYYSDVQVWQK